MKLILVIFLIFCFIQCFYYILFLSQLGIKKKSKINKEGQKGVSLIVCAKNEANNLKENISHWLNQDYSLFELIIVDDQSTDETAKVLEKYDTEQRFRRIHHVSNGPNRGKRGALEYGIRNAKHELLLLTDADCVPISNRWISDMVNALGQKDIALGIGSYFATGNTLLSNLIQYETSLTYLQYLTAASIGIPYGGVGRNILYRKEIFTRGFPETPTQILSGDDDLWLKSLANGKNTNICIAPTALTKSTPPDTWQNWFSQKRRHYSTGKYYRGTTKLYTTSFLLSKIGVYSMFIPLLTINVFPKSIIVIPFLITCVIIMITTYLIQKRIEGKRQLTIIPLLDFNSIFLMVILGIFATFSPPKKWK